MMHNACNDPSPDERVENCGFVRRRLPGRTRSAGTVLGAGRRVERSAHAAADHAQCDEREKANGKAKQRAAQHACEPRSRAPTPSGLTVSTDEAASLLAPSSRLFQ